MRRLLSRLRSLHPPPWARRTFAFASATLAKFGKDNGYLLAAALSFNAAFAVFPLLLGLVALLAQIVPPAQAQRLVGQYAGSLLGSQARFVSSTLGGVRQARGTIGVVAAGLLVWSARGIFTTLAQTLDLVHGFSGPQGLGGQLRSNAKALVFALGCGVGMLFLTGLYWGIELVFARGAAPFGPSIQVSRWLGALQHGGTILGFFVGLILIYRFLPWGPVPWRDAILSGVVGVALWYPVSIALTFYITDVARLNAVYGSLSGIMAFYLWLDYTSSIVILAAEVGVVAFDRPGSTGPRPGPAPS